MIADRPGGICASWEDIVLWGQQPCWQNLVAGRIEHQPLSYLLNR